MRTTEEIIQIALQLTREWLFETEVTQPEPNRLDVRILHMEDLIPIIVGLRVQRLGYLSAITGLDLGPEADAMEVLYHFCTGEAVITLRVRVPRHGGSVPTASEVIPSAEAFERELREMFGIEVEGLQAPAHLYLPDDWEENVYPLRKDAALGLPEATP